MLGVRANQSFHPQVPTLVSELPKNPGFPFRPASSVPPPPSDDDTQDEVERLPLANESERIPLHDTVRLHPKDTGKPIAQYGPYVVYEEIARGGMGAVFFGKEPNLGREVAVKVMARELLDDEDAMQRFQREARATAVIQHPNVAMIYFVGITEDGAPYLAMEFINGGTLEKLIRDRICLPFSQTASLFIQTCEALRAAHKQGIIHRDIKPANLMLTESLDVKVVDFGLAKFFREESYRTVVGMVMGTPRYMSPEQAQGREADYRSDIYSVGATFYHLLTGRAPFDGNSPTQIMMKHVTSPLVPLRSINPNVPLEFDDVVRKCMAKDPNERYQDYADLITDLSRIKLQWKAKEHGTLVNSINDLPTLKMTDAGKPVPPVPSRRPPSHEHVTKTANEYLEQSPEEHGGIGRWIVIGVVAVLILIGALGALVKSDEKPETGEQPTTAKSGITTLLERIIAEQNAPAPAGAPVKPIDQDYLKYKATLAILDELNNALLNYEINKGKRALDLASVVESGIVEQNFNITSGNDPLDGWGNQFAYSDFEGTLRSSGLDGRRDSDDDIVMLSDGSLQIPDESVYQRLEEEERERRKSMGP